MHPAKIKEEGKKSLWDVLTNSLMTLPRSCVQPIEVDQAALSLEVADEGIK